jgi:hypothetical protein
MSLRAKALPKATHPRNDHELSADDGKRKLNGLKHADVGKVRGGHLRTRQDVRETIQSKRSRKIAAGGLLLGLSVSLVGCAAATGTRNTPTNSPTSYGMVIGSREKVKTSDGSYERITADKSSPLYTYNHGDGNPDYMKAAGWTESDGAAGHGLVIDYLIHEFVDSTALETGDKGYQKWHKASANKYYSGAIYQTLGKTLDSNVVLGNFAGADKIPALIHDGAPRVKELNLDLTGCMPYSDASGTKGIECTVHYDAAYRVSDASAIKFTADHTAMTPKQFLASARAKSSLKDGHGENLYRATGLADVVVGKAKGNKWNIIGFQATTDYDSSDFTNNG